MRYDTTFKNLFPDVKVLFTLLTESYPVKIENIEYASVKQRRTDLVAWLANRELLHLEVQSDHDPHMLWREWEYCGLIAERYGQIPRQIVLYVGNKSPNFETVIDSIDVKFRYHVVDIRDLDSTQLLESNSLSDNLLALLGKLEDKPLAVQRVLQRIVRLDKNRRADMLEKLAILAGLRPAELPKLIKQELEEMPISVDLEENPLFMEFMKRAEERGEKRGEKRGEERGEKRGEERGEKRGEERGEKRGEERGEKRGEERGEKRGEERGRQEGKRMAEIAILRRLLEKRFSPLPEWVNPRLEHASTEQLEVWSLRILDASCLEDVFISASE